LPEAINLSTEAFAVCVAFSSSEKLVKIALGKGIVEGDVL